MRSRTPIRLSRYDTRNPVIWIFSLGPSDDGAPVRARDYDHTGARAGPQIVRRDVQLGAALGQRAVDLVRARKQAAVARAQGRRVAVQRWLAEPVRRVQRHAGLG